ncbi:MAG: T9SS type A sorting domain-containing protein [Cryomorphaceae bacterium]
MRKFTLIVASGLISAMSFGQSSWSDNFDSYTSGDYLGVAGADKGWTTWSGTTGGAEDVQVTDADAQSASNSIYFDGASTGGPHDVVLDFGQEYNTGTWHMDLAIKSDSGFYINLQGESVIGSTWALQVYVIDDSLGVDDAAALYYWDEFTDENEWVTLSVDVNLDSNLWTVSWDGTELATFENGSINQIASMDIYPLDGSDDYYIDDVNWSWNPSPRPVTFKVDMNYFTGTVGAMAVAGNHVNNWCGGCNLLSDGDADGIWETTVMIAADSIEYKFLMDDWATSEQFAGGEACTKTTGGFTNRFLVVPSAGVVLDPVCWEQCDTCSVPTGVAEFKTEAPLVYPNPTNDVINVEFGSAVKDMNISVYDLTGREVVRAFNAFNGTKAVINVSTLPQGAYSIVGNSDNVRFQESIIIAQ